jgi:hypothetical protein
MPALNSVIVICVLACSAGAQATAQMNAASSATPSPPLSVDDIVRQMVNRNSARAHALLSFEGKRLYRLDYTGFPGRRHAEMMVNMRYHSPDAKEFTIVFESGSSWLVDHVLKRLLQSEKEGTRDRSHIDLNPDNYNFALLGYEGSAANGAYLLSVQPKTDHKFLYRGRIWVDSSDFAVTRIEAEPAVNPSFWTKQNQIHYTYIKVGDFWLPRENYTVSNIRFGGHAVLSIQYQDYRITDARPLSRPAPATARLPLADTEE